VLVTRALIGICLVLTGVLVSACSGGAGSAVSSGTRTAPTSRSAASVVFVEYDIGSSVYAAYPRLMTSTVDGYDRHPLLAEGLLTGQVLASRDGSALVFDTAPAPHRAGTVSVQSRTWWVSDTTGTRTLPGIPADARVMQLSADGRSLLLVTGSRLSPTVAAISLDLASGEQTTLCGACIHQVAAEAVLVSVVASPDLRQLAVASGFQPDFYGMQPKVTLSVIDLASARTVWATDVVGDLTPVELTDDGSLTWITGDATHATVGFPVHHVTGLRGSSPADKATGIDAVLLNPASDGWWWVTSPLDQSTGPLTFHHADTLTSSRTVVSTWPAGPQIEDVIVTVLPPPAITLPSGSPVA
jgi:hypothetical protein